MTTTTDHKVFIEEKAKEIKALSERVHKTAHDMFNIKSETECNTPNEIKKLADELNIAARIGDIAEKITDYTDEMLILIRTVK